MDSYQKRYKILLEMETQKLILDKPVSSPEAILKGPTLKWG